MKKGFKFRYLAVAIIVCALIVWIAVMSTGDKKAGIEGNKVDFSCFAVKLLMGKPDKETYWSESGTTIYEYYDRTFFGHNGSISYWSFIQVDRIILNLNVSDDEAYALFSTISQSIENEYKDQKGFYCNPVEQTEDGGLEQKMGVDKGACDISITLTYLNGKLRVDEYYLR